MHNKTKMNAALIGLGINTNNYVDGFLASTTINLVVTCDTNENAVARHHFANIPFVTNYKDIITAYEVDVIFIVTPPATHYEIAAFFLAQKINVVVEKPPVLALNDYNVLKKLAQQNNVQFLTAYHWTFGPEVLFLQSLLPKLGPLLTAEVTVFDPYAASGVISDGRTNLGGAWLDSGSNALSALCFLFPELTPKLRDKNMIIDHNSGHPLFSRVTFEALNATFNITIDWREDRNFKASRFVFQNGEVYVPHTAQQVIVNGEVVADFNDRPRLLNHYYFMLRDFSFTQIKTHMMNEATLDFLYEVNRNV